MRRVRRPSVCSPRQPHRRSNAPSEGPRTEGHRRGYRGRPSVCLVLLLLRTGAVRARGSCVWSEYCQGVESSLAFPGSSVLLPIEELDYLDKLQKDVQHYLIY